MNQIDIVAAFNNFKQFVYTQIDFPATSWYYEKLWDQETLLNISTSKKYYVL